MRPRPKHTPPKPLAVQQAFIAWLAREQHRLALPVRLQTVRGAPVVRWDGVPSTVYTYLSGDELSVWVDHMGRGWDMLLSDSFRARRRHGGGYVCVDCEADGEASPVWSTLDAFWAEHVFEGWLQWVNEHLALASHLTVLGGPGEGATWARLKRVCGPLPPPGRWRLRVTHVPDEEQAL